MRQTTERAGYSWLINGLDLRCVPLDHECVIGSRQALSQSAGGVKVEVFAKGYAREHRAIDQMLFDAENGRHKVLATVINGEMSGLFGRFLIDCPFSKSAKAEVGQNYRTTSDHP